MWELPHYQFFPLLLIGVAVLGWLRLRDAPPLVPGSPRVGYGLAAAAWVLLAMAELVFSPWLAMVAALVIVAAVIWAVGGAPLFRRMFTTWLLLWFIVPPPFGMDRMLILNLQSFTASWGSKVLDYVNVYHVMAGNVVEISGQRLLVEESCAGINSLISVLAVTGFYLFLVKRGWVRATLLVMAAVGWVLVGNVVRVVLVAWLQTAWNYNVASGWRHEALGMGMFVLALLLVWSTDRFLAFVVQPTLSATPKRKEPAAPLPAPAKNLAAAQADAISDEMPAAVVRARGSWLTSWGLAGSFALLFAAHLALYGSNAFGWAKSLPHLARLDGLDAQSMPATLADCKQGGYSEQTRDAANEFGHFSKAWEYRLQSSTAAFALDYPFPSWHDLTICYTSQGWTVGQREVHAATEAEGATRPFRYVEVQLSKPGNRSGYLLFCEVDSRGEYVDPPAAGAPLVRSSSPLKRLLASFGGDQDLSREPEQPVYQLQVFVESYAPLSPKEQGLARTLFIRGQEHLHQFFPAGRVENYIWRQ